MSGHELSLDYFRRHRLHTFKTMKQKRKRELGEKTFDEIYWNNI